MATFACSIVVVASGLDASPAAAGSTITVSPASAPQGGTVTISGNVPAGGTTSCPAGDPAQLTSTAGLFPPDGFGPQASRDANGDFSSTYTIPTSTPVGVYTIGVRCGGGNVGISATVQVTTAPAAASITVSPPVVQAGNSVAISGVVPLTGASSCPASDAAQLTSTAALFPPDGFGPQVARDSGGNFHTSYTIPSSTAPGTYSVGLRCGGGNVGVSTTLDVRPTATTTTGTSTSRLPTATPTTPPVGAKNHKSSNVGWIALSAIVLVVIAAGAAMLLRRRGASATGR